MTNRILARSWMVLVACCASAGLAAYCSSPQNRTVTFDPPYPERDAGGATIMARFEGRISPLTPARGDEKLKVSLVLYHDPKSRAPASYWLGVVGERGNERIVSTGAWRLSKGAAGYPDAVTYVLDDKSPAGLRHFWQAGENVLLILDEAGAPRPGDASWGMMLSRETSPYGPKTYEMVDGKYVIKR